MLARPERRFARRALGGRRVGAGLRGRRRSHRLLVLLFLHVRPPFRLGIRDHDHFLRGLAEVSPTFRSRHRRLLTARSGSGSPASTASCLPSASAPGRRPPCALRAGGVVPVPTASPARACVACLPAAPPRVARLLVLWAGRRLLLSAPGGFRFFFFDVPPAARPRGGEDNLPPAPPLPRDPR